MENKNITGAQNISAGTATIARAEEAAAAIPITELAPMRIDPMHAAFSVLAALPQIAMVRSDVIATFGDDGRDALDVLEPAATAAFQANAAYLADSDPELETQATALAAQRDQLRLVAEAAIERGLVKANALKRLVGGNSYEGLATDTHALAAWIEVHRERLGEHCKVSAEEIAQAQRDAAAFHKAIAARERLRPIHSGTGLRRAQAFTHLLQAYDTARQFIGYVRWHEGDADQIAPSLYAGRSRRSDTDVPADDPTETEPNPALSEPATPVAAPVAPSAVTTTPAAPVNPIPPGMPGADPFIRNP